MTRLIDADALIEKVKRPEAYSDYEYAIYADGFIDDINDAPTIETSGDLISRTDAIERVELITKCEWDNNVIYRDEVIDALKFAPSADRPTLTEEVREAIMRLTMCAREECDICKFGHNHDNDCNFSKQVNRATENMNTILNAFKSADRPMGEWEHKPSKSGEWIWWQCSECGAVIYSESEADRKIHHAYCGVCGARMGEKK